MTALFKPRTPVFFFSVLIFFSFYLLPSIFYSLHAAPATPLPSVQTYEELLKAVRQTRNASQTRVQDAIQQEKVREAWEIGKLIDSHVLGYKERAEYDKQVMPRLAKDLVMSEQELYRMLKFARTYPILSAPIELSWAHYRELLSLQDHSKMKEIEKKAAKKKWDHKKLREEVKRLNEREKEKSDSQETSETVAPAAAPIPPPALPEKLEAKPGKLNAYPVVFATAGKDKGEHVLDLGFSSYYRTDRRLPFREGQVVEFVIQQPGLPPKLKLFPEATKEDLYTYKAEVLQVIDGDTLVAVISLGFGFSTVQRLRLRGLDCPELPSREGVAAKVFLEKLLRGALEEEYRNGEKEKKLSREYLPIVLRTVKSDKYDRYLADIFLNGEYVNQRLVDEGHALIVAD